MNKTIVQQAIMFIRKKYAQVLGQLHDHWESCVSDCGPDENNVKKKTKIKSEELAQRMILTVWTGLQRLTEKPAFVRSLVLIGPLFTSRDSACVESMGLGSAVAAVGSLTSGLLFDVVAARAVALLV